MGTPCSAAQRPSDIGCAGTRLFRGLPRGRQIQFDLRGHHARWSSDRCSMRHIERVEKRTTPHLPSKDRAWCECVELTGTEPWLTTEDLGLDDQAFFRSISCSCSFMARLARHVTSAAGATVDRQLTDSILACGSSTGKNAASAVLTQSRRTTPGAVPQAVGQGNANPDAGTRPSHEPSYFWPASDLLNLGIKGT